MKFGRAAAALAATVKGLFARKPKRVTQELEMPAEQPARSRRALDRRARRRRRFLLQFSFTRLLARKPIGPEAARKIGAAWHRGLQAHRDRWTAARANSTTVRLGRREAKAKSRLARARRVAAMKRLAQ